MWYIGWKISQKMSTIIIIKLILPMLLIMVKGTQEVNNKTKKERCNTLIEKQVIMLSCFVISVLLP